VILGAAVLGIWVLLVGPALQNTPVFGYIRGGTADWLVTGEAWSGGDPYAPLDRLAEQRLGWPGMEPTDPHPRPPSALLLLGPLGLSPSGSVIVVLAAVNALALSIWVVASLRWMGLSPRVEFVVIALAVVPPSVNSVVWGSHIPIMAACLGIGFLWQGRPGYRASGIALASGFKLFPFLLAFAVRQDRIRVIVLASSFFAGLTLAGLLLPGVELGDAAFSLVNAPETYGTTEATDVNLSINGTIGWDLGSVVFPMIGVVVVAVASNFISRGGAISLALIAMVLFAPYAWPEYMILWFPALIYLWKLATPARFAVLAYLVVVVTARDGTILMTAGLLLLLTLVLTESWLGKDRPVAFEVSTDT
jgi:hypothetical protein